MAWMPNIDLSASDRTVNTLLFLVLEVPLSFIDIKISFEILHERMVGNILPSFLVLGMPHNSAE